MMDTLDCTGCIALCIALTGLCISGLGLLMYRDLSKVRERLDKLEHHREREEKVSMMFSQAETNERIERCINEGRNLSEWEKHYLESISEQMDRTGSISARQEEILTRIYEERVR